MKMKLIALSLLSALTLSAHAEKAMTAKEELAAATKAANTQYAEDKKLCAEQSDSKARMQCLRDAKDTNTKAIAKAKADVKEKEAKAKAEAACKECGKVVDVKVTEIEGKGTGLGAVGGAVVGGVAGNQVGKGTGKDVATAVGVVGGAIAGHKVEEAVRSSKKWTVSAKFNDGSTKSFNFDKDPGLKAGDAVKTDGKTVTKR